MISGYSTSLPAPLELPPKKPHPDLIHVPPLDEPVLPEPPLGLESELRVHLQRALVRRVDREADLVQVQRLEPVAAEERGRLRPETLIPVVFPADHDPELGVPVDGR